MPNARISDQLIHYHVSDGCAVLRPQGACNSETTEAMARLANSSLVQSKHLIVDLSRVDYVETPGYRWMVRQLRQLESSGKTLVVAGLPSSVERVFRLLRLDQTVPVAKNVSDAMKLIHKTKQHAAA